MNGLRVTRRMGLLILGVLIGVVAVAILSTQDHPQPLRMITHPVALPTTGSN